MWRGAAGWLALAVTIGLAPAAGAQPGGAGVLTSDGSVVLRLPRPPRADAAGRAWVLEIGLGVLGAGAQVEVNAASGEPLGTISPHGPRAGRAVGSYSLPVPADAVRGGRLALRITVLDAAGRARAPAAGEVISVRLLAP